MYIRLHEAAERLGVHHSTIYRKVRLKQIKSKRKGKFILVSDTELGIASKESKKTRAEKAVARANREEPRTPATKPKHLMRLYTHEDGHSIRSPFTIRSWGELLDILISCERNGTLIEELHMECNI